MKRTPAIDVLSLDQQVCFPIYAASNLLQRIYRPLLEPLGLTYAQYLVMLVLWERDGLTVKDLEARVLLDSGTLSPLLRRLEKQGLLARRPFADDGRVTVLTLTAAGRKLRARAVNVPEALVCRMLGGQRLDEAGLTQVATLRSQLQALVGRLEEATRRTA
ncbi:MAG: MarR family transcriptional regulator [Archangium sp.]|nr:MarR family transcriptional regulator [Archangium sp.]